MWDLVSPGGYGTLNRYDREVGNLVLTRHTVGDERSTIVFGFKPEREIGEILSLNDVAFELNFSIIEERGLQIRTQCQTPQGFGILRGEIFDEEVMGKIERLLKDRPHHKEFPQQGLIYTVWVHKPAVVKMLQSPKLIELFEQTGFLPMFRLRFWKGIPEGSSRKDDLLLVTLAGFAGRVMFKKATLTEFPEMGSR